MTTTNTSTNDYSLLRDFDVEAAKAGVPICTKDGLDIDFIHEHKGYVFATSDLATPFTIYKVCVKMKPLFWLEGKPVYVGDTVYHVAAGKGITTDKKNSWGEYMVFFENPTKVGSCGCIISNLSLSPFPPVKQERKGWINIWKNNTNTEVQTGSQVYETKANALAGLDKCSGLIDTIEITWME